MMLAFYDLDFVDTIKLPSSPNNAMYIPTVNTKFQSIDCLSFGAMTIYAIVTSTNNINISIL